MTKPVFRKSVEMAVEILGGNDAVAHYLGVTPEDVVSWLAGTAEPAVNYFLRMVDLIEESTVKAARTATVVRSRKDETLPPFPKPRRSDQSA